MPWTPADPVSVSLFVLLYLLVNASSIHHVLKLPYGKAWSFVFIMLTFIISGLAITGITLEHPIPIGPILLVLNLIFCVSFAFSKTGMLLARSTQLKLLIGIQLFRLPLELILHHWSEIGTIPETMTWTGQNIDILTGILAFVSIPFLDKSKALAWIINISGFVLLINVLRVAMMSSPFPFSWDLDQPLLLAMYMPYALIVPGFVGVALMAHLMTFRKLLLKET